MSETQQVQQEEVQQVVDVVSEEANAIDAEQRAFLNEDDPDQPTELEPGAQDPQPQQTMTAEEIQALVEERDNLKKAVSEVRYNERQTKNQQRQTQQQIANIQETLQKLTEPARERGQEPVIDPAEDPIKALQYLTDKVAAYEKQEADRQAANQRQQQQTQVIQVLTGYMEDGEEQARQQFPDYDNAASWQVQSRAAELQALGHTSERIVEIVRNEYLQLIANAHREGQNPAYMVYQQAKARGYNGQVAQQNGNQDQPQQQQQPQDAAAQKQLDAMRKGQDAPKTVRGNGSGASAKTVTHEQVMNATGAEFDRLWDLREKQMTAE